MNRACGLIISFFLSHNSQGPTPNTMADHNIISLFPFFFHHPRVYVQCVYCTPTTIGPHKSDRVLKIFKLYICASFTTPESPILYYNFISSVNMSKSGDPVYVYRPYRSQHVYIIILLNTTRTQDVRLIMFPARNEC